MRIITITLLVTICSLFCIPLKGQSVKLSASGLYISFGTGDFLGYGIGVGVSKNLIKKPRLGLGQLLVGGELFFEQGKKEPTIYDTSPADILYNEPTFYHVSGSSMWAKAEYHPLHKVLPGLYLSVGPTIGYWNRTKEEYAGTRINNSNRIVRISILEFDNGAIVGYRLSGGINFNISTKTYVGARMDFSNNTKGEINSLLGLKLGFNIN
ncbi:hypothetical protein ABDK00_017495 [Niabella insulamsoli]|uniref:hypothetical protein n=1 Tax=Niabella insulamsoli TaxID=3144874 RepID=UPI0031FDC7AC